MNVQIQSVKFDADARLVDFINQKIGRLDRFIERAISAEVILKLDRDFEKGNKVVTVTVAIPGNDLVAEARCKSFEEAVDQCVDALKRQIEKYKDKVAR